MKKTAFRIFTVALSAIMLLLCTACTSTLNVRFVNKAGEDLFGGGAADVTTVPAADVTTAAPVADATTAAPVADDTTAAPSGETPATDAPSGETPATAAPATDAPSGETPATAAPATQAPVAAGLSSSSSKEEIVAKYIEVYNATKATGTFIGRDSMECTSVTLEGKENSAIKKLAGSLMGTDASKTHQLPPFNGNNDGKTCVTTAADIETAVYADNGDGTATIKLTPKSVTNSRRFADAQGNMFNVMEDVASALSGISAISWSEGDANSNVVLTSEGGYCEITFNTSTNIMTKANYILGTTAAVTHANVLIFKDKSATAKFVYTMSYPA